MKLHHRLLLALVPFFSLPTAAFSQTSAVPSLISYQGTVFQADGVTPLGQGTPVNRSVVFRIWNHQSNSALADLIYSETQVVTIADGQFSVLVGEGVATTVGNYGNEASKKLTDLSTAFSSGDRYLGVTVAAGAALLATDNEISPRQRIVSTGFALRAKLAESLAGGNDFILNPTTVPANSVASNYGVGWYGTGRLFGTTAVDGPVLFGNSGGALGSSNGSGGTKNLSLLWNNSGQVGIGATGNFAATSKLTLQGDDASSPASQLVIRGNTDNNERLVLGFNTAANNATLQSYSAASTAGNLLLNPAGGNVLLNPVSGNVGIGMTNPGFPLNFPNTLGDKISLYGNTGSTYGFGIQGSLLQIHTDSPGSDVSFGYGSSVSMTETMRISGSGNLTVRGFDSSITVGTSNGERGAVYLGNSSHGIRRNYSAGNDVGLYTTAGSVYLSANGAGNTKGLAVTPSGNVGIGTGDPTQARLVIDGSVSHGLAQSDFFTRLGGLNQRNNTSAVNVSVYASGIIAGAAIHAFSDERIKSIEKRSDAEMDLSTLLGIEITDYRYKDAIRKGSDLQKKVIAQQVEKVFPQAVSKSTDVVPDIYQMAEVDDGWVKLATSLEKGERVRLISEKKEGIHEVLEVAEGRFRADGIAEGGKVFVYGREVKDFRTVDYDAIAMLNVSATQQIKKEKDAEVTRLREENSELRTRVAALEAKEKARDAKMASIEKLLGTTEQPVTRTISIQSK